MKSYTDIEQSKKLAEILPIESADMWWSKNFIYYNPTAAIGISAEYSNVYTYKFGESDIPCWSLAALLDILPSEFKYYETTYEIDIRKYVLTNDVDLYQIAYRNCKIDENGHHSWKDIINTGEKEDLIDACVEMILKLKQRNLL